MKLTDNLVKKVGADKLLHLLVGALSVAYAALFHWAVMLVVTVVLVALSVYKEYRLDCKEEIRDIYWCGIGILITWAVYAISLLV